MAWPPSRSRPRTTSCPQRGRGQWRGIAVGSARDCDLWTMSLAGRALPRARHIAKFLGLAGCYRAALAPCATKYTYVHEDLRESLDHVLVNEQVYDNSTNRRWSFDGLVTN